MSCRWCMRALASFVVLSLVSCGDDAQSKPPTLPILSEIPAFTLTDETGASFGSADLSGNVWVADFVFTRCPTTCPIQTAQMKRLQDRLRSHLRWANLRLISFSVDPTYDVPAVLKIYGTAAGADPEHWKFLTGEREAIWSLSADGFKLAAGESAEGDGPLFHSTKFVLVDAAGRIRGYYDGVEEEAIDALVRDLDVHADDLWGAS